MAVQNVKSFALDREALKVFPPPHQKILVYAGSETMRLDPATHALPVAQLGAYLRGA